MKILFFTNIPSPYRVDFFNELGKYCDLTVLYERQDAKDRNVNWLKGGANKQYKEVFLKGKKIGNDTAICPEVMKYWKDKQYDIRIVGDYATPTGAFSCLYMKLHSISYVIECDGGYLKDGEKAISRMIKKKLLSSCKFAFSPGKITNDYLIHYGVDRGKIKFYPFTSLLKQDIEKARMYISNKYEYRKELGISENKVVLSVGQMIHRKGFDILLEAAKDFNRDVGFYIVGGTASPIYQDFVADNHLSNVHFVDFMSKWELAKYYSSADLFVLPTRDDIWGLVIQEAMSFGLPIITTDKCVSGVELIGELGGRIIPTEDIQALSDAMQALLFDAQMCKQMADQNLKIIEKYTIEFMVEAHLRVFSEGR